MINEQRLLDRFLEYVQIDSPTKEEKNFQDRLIKDLKDLGIEYEIDQAGEAIGGSTGNLIAKLPGKSDKTLLFSSHMDTVDPGIGIKPQIKDGVIYSDGTTILGSDDKAGVAAIMEMLTVLVEEGLDHHNIEVAFTIAEEGGLYGSKNLDYSRVNPDMAFVLDTGGPIGTIIVQGPAQNKINAVFKGKKAHAGVAPESGVSAIQIAADAISKMDLLRIDQETTANIGYINGGGPTNIVTDEVTIHAEARSLDNKKLEAQTDHMVQAIKDAQAKYGIEAQIEVDEAYKAFEVDQDSEVVLHAIKACENLGFEPILKASGGGSDTNNFNLNGIPAVNLSAGMNEAHTVNENIVVDDLIKTGQLVLELAKL